MTTTGAGAAVTGALAALGAGGVPAVGLAAWAVALLIGLALGVLGSGGSILAVPLLAQLLGLPFDEARATSLPIVGGVALVGLVAHARRGTVRPVASLPFVLASAPAAFAAARWLAPWMSSRAQASVFAGLMFVAAWRMALPRRDGPAARARPTVRVLLVGAGVGTATGLLGVGGGFLIVPALVLGLGFDARAAIGTSLLVVVVNCASALAATLAAGDGGLVHGDLALAIGAVGAIGVLLGARYAGRVALGTLRRAFAATVVVLAAWLLLAAWR